MNEQTRIEPKQRVGLFGSWLFAGGWQLIATSLALYLLWDIAASLNQISSNLWRISVNMPQQ
jgi:hypothetical protein